MCLNYNCAKPYACKFMLDEIYLRFFFLVTSVSGNVILKTFSAKEKNAGNVTIIFLNWKMYIRRIRCRDIVT